MKKYILSLFLSTLTCIFLISCEDEVNQWEVEEGHDRLFRTLVFDVVKVDPTAVEVKFNKVVNANKYVFEFSEDSLEFNQIVKRVEVLADTLTPFASSTTVTRTEYRTVFDELNGTTGYSVRMQAIDTESDKQSEYSLLYFETGAEQIFTSSLIYTNKIQLFWEQTDRVTSIAVSDPLTQEIVAEKTLTDEEIANASAVVEGLNPGTTYAVQIFHEARERGVLYIQTTGLASGAVVEVTPSDVIADLVAAAVADGNEDITLVFEGGTTYEIGSLSIPSGVTNLNFTGAPGDDGMLPVLNMTEVRLTDLVVSNLVFENLEISGDYGRYFIYLSSDNNEVGNIEFKRCRLNSFRSIVRLSNNLISVNKIDFNDCLIHNIGGYGVVNIGGSSTTVDTVSFANSTLTELATQLVDIRTPVSYMKIGNNTFCNLTSSMSQLLRLDANQLPLTVETENNIIAGTNGGAKINSLSFDMSSTGLNVSFGGSYMTNELEINKYEFANITVFQGDTYDLFIDPDNHDFRVNPESGFGGLGTAGDPRWFE